MLGRSEATDLRSTLGFSAGIARAAAGSSSETLTRMAPLTMVLLRDPDGIVMLCAPRDDHEFDLALEIVCGSYEFAAGATAGASMSSTE